MTTNKLTADQLSDLVERAKTAQENLSEAWLELSRIHDEFFEGDSHIRAYVLDQLRILISDDHGFLSRDSSVDSFIEELQEAFEEADEPGSCAVCGNPYDTARLQHDLCDECHWKYAKYVGGIWVALWRGGRADDGPDTIPYFGWTIYKPMGQLVVTESSHLHWCSLGDALANGVVYACNIQLEETQGNVLLEPPASPVDPLLYAITKVKKCSTD